MTIKDSSKIILAQSRSNIKPSTTIGKVVSHYQHSALPGLIERFTVKPFWVWVDIITILLLLY